MRTIKFRIFDGSGFEYSGGTPTMLMNFFAHNAVFHTRDRQPFEQFTGLYDKHGTEIYEGDIVIADWHWTKPTQIEFPDDIYEFTEFFGAVVGETVEAVEIIGNIHENPELLK